MSRRDDKSRKKTLTIIDIILMIIVIVAGVVLTILQGFGDEFYYIIPIIVTILVLAIIVHIIFLWGIKKGVIVDRRRHYRPQTPSSYDPIRTDSYDFTTNEDFLADRPDLAEREAARQRAQQERMTVTITPQTQKSNKLKSPTVDPSGLNCSVCKLMIRDNQAVLECPRCGALFHKKHILEWLEEHDDCPICNHIITK
ncbi:MAG: RING finger domain-containing protein [Candidatus Heimdallarchaeota archaeon]